MRTAEARSKRKRGGKSADGAKRKRRKATPKKKAQSDAKREPP